MIELSYAPQSFVPFEGEMFCCLMKILCFQSNEKGDVLNPLITGVFLEVGGINTTSAHKY